MDKVISRQFFVQGHEVIANIDLSGGTPSILFVWNPVPTRLGHRLKVEYRKKRNAVMQVVAQEIGQTILMIDDFDKDYLLTAISPDKEPVTKRSPK